MYKNVYIVTPSFNAAKTIKRTIKSIINQLGGVDYLRYHIQDGGSSDETQAIIKYFCDIIKNNPSKYSKIDFSWSSENDNGMYDAITKGFQKMSIPDDAFMGWLNADDILFPRSLEQIFNVITTLPNIQWIGGRRCMIDENDIIIYEGGSHEFYPQYLIENGCCDGKHWYYLQQEGTFWQKKIWDSVGGLNIELRYAGDWDLWRRMAQQTPFIYCPFITGAFRKRPGQLSSHPEYQAEIDLLLSQKKRRNACLRFLISNKRFKKLDFQGKTWFLYEKVSFLPFKEKLCRFLIVLNMIKLKKLLSLICHIWSK